MKSIENTSSTHTVKSTQPEDFDLVILGGGTGSTVAAWTFAAEKKRVAVIDRKYIGGSCPNIACLPSKNIIHSAKIASYLRNSDEFGIAMDGFSLDMSAVRTRKRKMVSGLNEMYLENYKNTGAELIFGTGRFLAPKTIEVVLRDGGVRQLRGTNVIISTGTRATLPPVPGLAEAQPLTHIEALELERIPEHLLVLGGGYVGIELSQAMRRFGSSVSVLDTNDRLLPREDDDVCDALRTLLQDEGIDVVLNVHPRMVSGKSGNKVQVVAEQNGAGKTFTGSHILVAVGRTPNTEGLGLELAGVELTGRGYVKVNERLQTTSPGIWAIGKVAGSPQFTHISIDDFRIVHSALNGGRRTTAGRQVPYCLFTDPELARIGLNEREAKAGNVAYRLFKVSMEANLRARTLGETQGFMKALVEADGERILGFTALGVGAGEIMAAVQVAMIAGLPYAALRDAVLTHPTLTEGLAPLFSSAASSHKAATTGRFANLKSMAGAVFTIARRVADVIPPKVAYNSAGYGLPVNPEVRHPVDSETRHPGSGGTPSPQCLPARQTHRNNLPAEIPAAATHRSMVALTHSGTGTVRMWPPLPTRSTIAQCSSRCCKCANSRWANSRRRSPQPSKTARIAGLVYPSGFQR